MEERRGRPWILVHRRLGTAAALWSVLACRPSEPASPPPPEPPSAYPNIVAGERGDPCDPLPTAGEPCPEALTCPAEAPHDYYDCYEGRWVLVTDPNYY